MKTIAKMISGMATGALVAAGTIGMAQDLPQIFHVNPARSSATFSIPALGEQANGKPDGVTKGSLQVQKSTLRFVEDTGMMSGQVVLRAGSESSGSHTRDVAMRTQVLKAPEYGTITFTPTKYQGEVKRTGDSEIQVTGTVSALGHDHAVTLPVKVHSNGFELSAQGELAVPYLDWGMSDLTTAGIRGAKEVDVTLKLVGYVGPRN